MIIWDDEALILSARAKIEKEPNYSNVAAALAVNALYKEVFRYTAFEIIIIRGSGKASIEYEIVPINQWH